ncbi:hypothetical protein LXM94_02020, partial [Rhizobium sp. TRM95111]|uniref:hypothetical protein n=1 Tax=Rhizobium alarense TaxID=2846851 RepID=UPI001F3E514F
LYLRRNLPEAWESRSSRHAVVRHRRHILGHAVANGGPGRPNTVREEAAVGVSRGNAHPNIEDATVFR